MTGDAADLAALAFKTQEVYERSAHVFDALRDKSLFERAWLDRFLSHLPDNPTILDLGCGAAEPIAAYLISRGAKLTGLDASATMIRMARSRFPAEDWRQIDMRGLELGMRFHGILGWDTFFHLTPDEQRDLLPRLAAHLRPKGVLMLTVGPEAGEVSGFVGSDPVYHASLDEAEYRSCLNAAGVRIIEFARRDVSSCGRTILLAEKHSARV